MKKDAFLTPPLYLPVLFTFRVTVVISCLLLSIFMRLRAIISIGNYEFCLYSLTNLPFCVENLIYKILNYISIHWLIVQIL